jgi:predicted nucleic acid-binding protein
MSVLVDSSVILDIFTDDSMWFDWSSEAIAVASEESRLVINPVIYAEVSVRFSRIEELDTALPIDMFAREPIPYEATFLAGKAHMLYRGRGGTRSVPLPDFFIGAHGGIAGHKLLTRDPTRFSSYFPKLELISPQSG